MSCHSGLRILFHFNTLILLNSHRDWGLKVARGDKPIQDRIVGFELENILCSFEVKWFGGEDAFQLEYCEIWTVFFSINPKTWK